MLACHRSADRFGRPPAIRSRSGCPPACFLPRGSSRYGLPQFCSRWRGRARCRVAWSRNTGRNNRSFTSRETPCPVSETTSSTASRLATSGGRDRDFFQYRILHCFGGVVDQIGDCALDGFRIGHDSRQDRGRVRACTRMPSSLPPKRLSALSTRLFRLAGCGRDAGKRASTENSSTRLRTVWTALLMVSAHVRMTSSGSRIGRRAARQMAMNAFSGKGDRSQRILDLVCNAARDFAPGRLLLGAQQVREVFEDQHISQALRPDIRARPRLQPR